MHRVGRVGHHKGGARAVEQARDLLRVGAVANQHAVLTEDPQLACPDMHIGRVGYWRDSVHVDQSGPVDPVLLSELLERGAERLVRGRHFGQQRRQIGHICLGHRADGVERGENDLLLVRAEVDVRDRDERLAAGQGKLDPEVAIHEMAGRPIDDDLLDPPHLAERAAESTLLGTGMTPPVARVGDKELGRLLAVPDDADAPGVGAVAAPSAAGSTRRGPIGARGFPEEARAQHETQQG